MGASLTIVPVPGFQPADAPDPSKCGRYGITLWNIGRGAATNIICWATIDGRGDVDPLGSDPPYIGGRDMAGIASFHDYEWNLEPGDLSQTGCGKWWPNLEIHIGYADTIGPHEAELLALGRRLYRLSDRRDPLVGNDASVMPRAPGYALPRNEKGPPTAGLS